MEEQLANVREKAGQEIEQLRLYRQVYLETNPLPVEPEYETFNKKDYSFVEVVGVASVGFSLAAIGGIIYSAIRTAGVFVQKEVEQFEGYGMPAVVVRTVAVIASVTIMVTVEGFIAAWGYNKGKESGKLDVSWVGPTIAFFISALAGFLPSFSLLPDNPGTTLLKNVVAYVLFILSGFGIAGLIGYGAHNVGVIHTRWLTYLETKRKEIEARNKSKKEAYDTEIDQWNEQLQEDYRKLGRDALFEAGKFVVRRNGSKTPKPSSNGTGLTERVRQYLRLAGFRPSEVGEGDQYRMQPIDIANELNLVGNERESIRQSMSRLRKEERDGKWN